MAKFTFNLPDIGEGIAEAEIVAWHVKVGDMVEEDGRLADMMTDKATVEMESPVAGKVIEVAGEVGDVIAIGGPLVVIETEGEVRGESRRARVLRKRSCPAATPAQHERKSCRTQSPLTRPHRLPLRPNPSLTPAPTPPPKTVRAEPVEARVTTPAQKSSPVRRFASGRLSLASIWAKCVRPRMGACAMRISTPSCPTVRSKGFAPAGQAAARRDDQGHRPAPPDRREHGGVQAQHPALFLRRGMRRHRSGKAARRPQRQPRAPSPS